MDFNNIHSIIKIAQEEKTTISKIVLRETALNEEISQEEVYKKMEENLFVMEEAIKNGSKKDVKSLSGLTGGNAYKFKKYMEKSIVSGSFIGDIIMASLAVSEINACMGKVVAAPTAGSCGILPACLLTLEKHNNIPREKTVMGLINASFVGLIIAKNASISGAKGGCQAECGSASAMAASGMIEMMDGTPKMCGTGIATAIKSQLGLVCDPVAGLVEEPCIIRNVSSSMIAVSSMEMALAGLESIIPVDEVIKAMDQVGKQIPMQLKETSLGGLATTETGIRINKELFG